MPTKSWIERAAEALKLIPTVQPAGSGENLPDPERPGMQVRTLENFPPPERWRDWEEYDAGAWPRKVKRRYHLVPTTCFNCEAACGLVAYIDQDSGQIKRFEGNPYHPASRGRNCAKGPATINQVTDPDRILYPLKRVGPRGSGQWEQVSWEDALKDIGSRIGTALKEKRNDEIVYHVGRPGHEGYMDRVLRAWGVDGHNSHTNICSSAARFGYNLWQGIDRPSPDFANAQFILLLSAHLETGHYFNPHAQRIMEAMNGGTELAVMDPRLSNTASMATYWMPTYPGTEAAVLLAMAKVILEEGLYNRSFLHDWVNWQDWLAAKEPKGKDKSFERYIALMLEEYASFTPEYAAAEAGISAEQIVAVARKIGEAGTRFAAHNWRGASTGNLGGWQVARCLHFLSVLTGAVGTKGGTLPNSWQKFKPAFISDAPPQKQWNELSYPDEYPLTFFEMSQILPHLLKAGRGKLDVYFTRVFNPVWTYPDGFTWIEVLRDESKIGCHVALTPTWNETAYYADYVLPMGHSPERHDLNSYETHAGTWIAFRQPVLRRFAEERGEQVTSTYQANPGEVWEEDEFWIDLSWQIDPDGSLGVRKWFESVANPGEKLSIDEYYGHIFDRVPGLQAKAEAEGLTPLAYMKRYGAFEVEPPTYEKHMNTLPEEALKGTKVDEARGEVTKGGAVVGVLVEGKARAGFPTPSKKLEFYSATMAEWGWPEHTLPGYIDSHISNKVLDKGKMEYVLVPTFRLPNLIHSRSGNAKWLVEIAHRNPIWIHHSDADKLGVKTGDLLKLVTDIGSFVDKVWVTEAIKPGVVACSHHIGRWRPENFNAGNRWATNTVNVTEESPGQWRMRTVSGVQPYASSDPDTARIYWQDGGVHQNITHAVHPDPISGMHCWHQRVRLERPGPDDHYGDVKVDTNRSFEVFKEWLEMTRPPERKDGLRRPLWFLRPLKPDGSMYTKKK